MVPMAVATKELLTAMTSRVTRKLYDPASWSRPTRPLFILTQPSPHRGPRLRSPRASARKSSPSALSHVAGEDDDDGGEGGQHVEGDGDGLAQPLGAEGDLVGEDGQDLGGAARAAAGQDVDDLEVVEGPDGREEH